MAKSSQTGDVHGVLGFSAGRLRQAGRGAPADVVYLFFSATTTHCNTHTVPVDNENADRSMRAVPAR